MSFMFDALVTITRFRIFEISFPRFQGAVSTIKKTLNLGDREHNYCNKLYHYKLYNKVELSPSKKSWFYFLIYFWGHVGQRPNKKAKASFKICEVSDWVHPNISRSKSNQTMKLCELIEYNMRNNFLEKIIHKMWWISYT